MLRIRKKQVSLFEGENDNYPQKREMQLFYNVKTDKLVEKLRS